MANKIDSETVCVVLERLSQRAARFNDELMKEFTCEGYEASEIVWLMSQVFLSMTVAMHMATNVPLENLLEEVRQDWLNATQLLASNDNPS